MTENHRQPPTTITNYKTTYNHLQKNEKIHLEHCFYHFNAHRKCCLARASRKLRIQLSSLFTVLTEQGTINR